MKKCLFTVLLLFVFCTQLYPDEFNPEKVKSELNEIINANNSGNDFWFTVPPCFYDESGGADNYIKIYVASRVPASVTVEVAKSNWIQQKNVSENTVIDFTIQPSVAMPYEKNGISPEIPEMVYEDAGIHVYADEPIVVYCVVRYKWTSDGFLVYPVSALGTEYVAAGYTVDPMFSSTFQYKLPNILGIVAAFDDTRVNFKLGYTRGAGTTNKPGDSVQVVLQAGDVFMLSSLGAGSDLSGSVIQSSKPISVVSGNMCANIPNGNQWCDYIAEMLLPTYSWGTAYHVPYVINRKYAPVIRIFNSTPNTTIFKDGQQIAYLPEYGTGIDKSFLEMRLSSYSGKPALIHSDQPISVMLYNTGVQEDGSPYPASDPFQMLIYPVEQYQTEIAFCTPGTAGGLGFDENYLAIVYELDSLKNMDDSYEIATIVNGELNWVKLSSWKSLSEIIFQTDLNGISYKMGTYQLPREGMYKIKSKKHFAVYSYGYSPYDSYGYPAGTAIRDWFKQDTEAPHVIVNSGLIAGSEFSGTVTDFPADFKKKTNLAKIIFHKNLSNNFNFSYDRFIPGETTTTSWKLEKINPNENASATITFTDRAGNDTTIFLSTEPAGIDDLSEQGVRIYPNPAQDKIIICSKENSINTIIIFDAKANIIKRINNIENQNFSFDLKEFTNGTYFVKIITEEHKDYIRKFTINR